MLKVNEIYGPVKQGEGKSLGLDVLFIRLSGCNLACIWCDTPYTWNWVGTKFQHPDKYDPQKETHEMDEYQVRERLIQLAPLVRSIVVSGGEPLLQQKGLVKLFRLLKADGYWIEVETNGTVLLDDDFVALVDQINCSPKTSNSGPDNKITMRERPFALSKLARCGKTYFKFVVASDGDLEEVLDLTKRYRMTNVYLMPEGRTREELIAREDAVRAICEQCSFTFSPRLHIMEHGNKRAV